MRQLSKSRYVAGVQCHKLLWLKVHESDAPELQPDKVLQDLFDQGAQVGQLARERFPGGVLIDLPFYQVDERVEATTRAMESGAPAIFEATFVADNTYVAVDILAREDDGWRLIEVKSSARQKDEHIPDAAVQLYVLEQCGVRVTGVEVMHLNSEFRHPCTGDLFERTDVSTPARGWLPVIPGELEDQLAMIDGPMPDVKIGAHCFEPRECPFAERCWPKEADHISKLYRVGGKTAVQYMNTGVHSIWDLPSTAKIQAPARRQIRSMRERRMIIEPGLARDLEPFNVKLGFLDFETISRAVPVWPGMKPWQQAAAQFSYHEQCTDGTYAHAEFLAEGPEDARPKLARAMIDATRGAERVVMYTTFERTRIRDLQIAVPDLRPELEELEHKLIDLHPVLQNNVYHPDFQGGFSLKYVLNPMVPDLTYNDLVIVDGMVASVEIARLLFVAQKIPLDERERVRRDLLEYCKRDTWAMVKLLERLVTLSRESAEG